MSSGIILTISFLVEAMLLALGVIIFLYFRLRKIKAIEASAQTENNSQEQTKKNLTELLDLQINRTRNEIDGQKQEELDNDQLTQKILLNKRIDYLAFEKEIAGEHVTDEAYWGKIYSLLNNILTINESTDETKTEISKKQQTIDISKYEERIAKYQAQLSALHREFEDYRAHARKLTGSLSDIDEQATQDAALKELMADFKAHDDRLHKRLANLQRENGKLEGSLSKAEREAYLLDYQLQKNKHSADKSELTNPSRASEEEIGRLRDIIGRQYGSIDELKHAVQNAEHTNEDQTAINDKLHAVEKSQQELQTCIEILEMENQRLTEALTTAELSTSPISSGDNSELLKQLAEKEEQFIELEREYGSLQEEFMHLYSRNQEG